MNHFIIGHSSHLPDTFFEVVVSEIKKTSYLSGKLTLDSDSPYFPGRSDRKIMRDDIIAAIISINNMIQQTNHSIDLDNTPIFVANGAFVENPDKYLQRVINVYKTFTPDMTIDEKTHKVYLSVPPLVALETLTNSTMSLIAQYTGLKGHNTTFGNTSLAAFHGISETMMSLNQSKTIGIVCSANCSGNYSFLTNSTLKGYSKGWKESAAVGSLIINSSEKVPKEASCVIKEMKSSTRIVDIETKEDERNWKNLLPDKTADLIIYSGAYSEDEHEKDRKHCIEIQAEVFSYFPEYGNMGPSNIILGLIKGIDYVKQGYGIVDIVDRDIYGRESFIRIERC